MGFNRLFRDNIALLKRFNVDRRRKSKYLKNISTDYLGPLDILKIYSPIFVLSTGRCGTDFLTRSLESTDLTYVNHNIFPELSRLSSYPYTNRQSRNISTGIILGARLEIIEHAYRSNLIYIETNNKITFFAKEINELMPNARFIHLKREKSGFVRSVLKRGYFSSDYIDDSHIKPPSYIIDKREKAEWIWEETNGYIDDFIKDIDTSRVFKLESNDLFFNSEKRQELLHFIFSKNGPTIRWPKRKINAS